MSAPPSQGRDRATPRRPTPLQRFAARCVHLALAANARTQRFRVVDPLGALDSVRDVPGLFAIWHNRLAFSIVIHQRFIQPLRPGRRLAALVSASRDGALLAAVLEAFGVAPVRGSSSRRGAQALVELRSWAEKGYDLAITPDGPRGPCYLAQTGVLALARVTGRPVIPVACNTPWKLRLGSWDRFQIPLPFGPSEVVFGRPVPPPDSSPESMEAARLELQRQLDAITRDT